MKFSSSGTSRKIRRKSVSVQAEACELRTLLSASATSVGVVDSLELPIDGGDGEVITVMDCAPPWGEIFIQPSFCAVIDGGNAWEYMHLGAIDYTLPIDYTPPIDPTEVENLVVDVTEVITGEAGSDETVDGEDIGLPQTGGVDPVDETVIYQNLPPVEGWDPSEVEVEEPASDPNENEEIHDAFDPLLLDDTVGEPVGVVDSLELPIDIDYTPPIDPTEVVNLDVDVTEVITGEAGSDESVDGEDIGLPQTGGVDPVDETVIYQNLPPVEGWDPSEVEVEEPASDPNENEEIHDAFDPLLLDDTVGEPVGVVDSLELPIDIDYTPPIDPTEVVNLDVDVTEVITGEAGSDESVDGEDIGLPQRPVDPDSGWLRWKYQYRSFVTAAGQETAGEVEVVDDADVSPNIYLPPVEGWDPSPASDTNEFVYYAFDPQPLDDAAGKPVDVVQDGELFDGDSSIEELSDLVPIRTQEQSDFDPSIIFFSAAASGVEVQRSNDSSNIPTAVTAPSTLAIPFKQTSATSLFSSNRDRSSVGISAVVEPNSALTDNAIPAKRNATQRRSSMQVSTATQSAVVSEGLNSLTPLLGEDAEPSRNDAPESTVDPQAIDDVMAQYAENSFNS